MPDMETQAPLPVTGRTLAGTTSVELRSGNAVWHADLEPSLGGSGDAPTPHQLLDSALAACTMLTLQLYAKRKGYPLEGIDVQVQRNESGGVYRIARRVAVHGALDDAQRTDLLRVANACPIHKALAGRFEVTTDLAERQSS